MSAFARFWAARLRAPPQHRTNRTKDFKVRLFGVRTVGNLSRHAVEEIGYGHVEHLADLEQPTCTDPVCAGFVFLGLLKTDTNGLSKRGLAHAKVFAPYLDAPADMDINPVEGGALALFTRFHPINVSRLREADVPMSESKGKADEVRDESNRRE